MHTILNNFLLKLLQNDLAKIINEGTDSFSASADNIKITFKFYGMSFLFSQNNSDESSSLKSTFDRQNSASSGLRRPQMQSNTLYQQQHSDEQQHQQQQQQYSQQTEPDSPQSSMTSSGFTSVSNYAGNGSMPNSGFRRLVLLLITFQFCYLSINFEPLSANSLKSKKNVFVFIILK